MKSHTFTIVLDRRPSDSEFDSLHDDSAFDDAIFGVDRGTSIVEFDREAGSMAEAIVSAVRDLESLGIVAVRVVDNDLLTLADIADRIGRSRESIRRYATAERGPGGFPPPVNSAHDGTVFYRWSEVSVWLREQLAIDAADSDLVLVAANLLLQARQLRGRVDHLAVLGSLIAA